MSGNGIGSGSSSGSGNGHSTEQNTLRLFKAILSGTIAMWFAILLIITLSKICFARRSRQRLPKRPIIISALILYISAFIGHTINAFGIISYAHWQNLSSDRDDQSSLILYSLYGFCAFIALISTYIFTESLLYYSFKGSSYEVSMKVIYCHTMNIILILGVVALIIIFRNVLDGYKSSIYVTMSIFISLLGFGLFHFVYLFNRTLFKLILANHDYDNFSRQHRQDPVMNAVFSFCDS